MPKFKNNLMSIGCPVSVFLIRQQLGHKVSSSSSFFFFSQHAFQRVDDTNGSAKAGLKAGMTWTPQLEAEVGLQCTRVTHPNPKPRAPPRTRVRTNGWITRQDSKLGPGADQTVLSRSHMSMKNLLF